jgi:hypothetical protein
MSDIVKHNESNVVDLAAWRALKEQAQIALSSRYLPKAIATPEQAITIAMAGRELGLSPMTAFRSIHLIDGKITMSADLMAGLALSRIPGSRVDVVHTDNGRAVVEAQRPGGKPVTLTFTIEDAQRAGLTGKDNWKKYPAAMLRARAIAAAARAVFPDVFLGVYTPEELEPEQHAAPVQFDAAPANGDALDSLLASIEAADSEAALAIASDAAKKVWRTLPAQAQTRVKEAAAAARARFVAVNAEDVERAAIVTEATP